MVLAPDYAQLLEPIDRRARIKGGGAYLWRCFEPEILFDGPAGTGKTFTVIRRCDELARKFPGCRILWVRETLKALRTSVQQIYEQHVLWPGHPALEEGGESRTHYLYPPAVPGGPRSRIELAGLDTPERLMSTEFDVIVVFEATNPHVTLKAWLLLITRARGQNIPHPECRYPEGKLPDGTAVRVAVRRGEFPGVVDEDGKPLFLNQLIADCNPDAETNWLWRRYLEGRMVRLQGRHEDNPMVSSKYLERLKALPGAIGDRLYRGKWTTTEAAIWGTYNQDRHLVTAEWEMEPLTGRRFVRVPDWTDSEGMPARFAVRGVVAGMDFGFTAPGSLEVLAVTEDKRAFLMAEVYAAGMGMEWWAEWAERLVDEFKIEVIRCDHDPENIKILNDRLGHRSGREVGGIAQQANKSRRSKAESIGGLDVVREAFRANRLFINRHCSRYLDPVLDAAHLPTSVVMEIPSYAFELDEKTGLRLEIPAKNSWAHGCDGVRYGYMDVWDREWKAIQDVRFVPPPGEVAYYVGSPQERARLRKLAERSRQRYNLT